MKTSFEICLDCQETHGINISNGWWSPTCENWSGKKSDDECKYGPKNGCPYMLEHVVMDNRLRFKMNDNAELYLKLVEYMDSKQKKYMACGVTTGKFVSRYLTFMYGSKIWEDMKSKQSMNDIVAFLNEDLRKECALNPRNHFVYWQIIKGGSGWALGRIDGLPGRQG